jgi:protein SCO1
MKLVVVAAFGFLLCSCARSTSALPVFYDVSEFQLTAQNGQPFSSRVLAGKIWLADFIYTTCPGPCPRMTSQMRELQDAIPDVDLISFTVDPAHDTPAVLAGYAQAHHADSARWHFLTGPEASLQTLDRDVFKLGDLDASLEHSTRFVLVDRRARIRGYYDTSEPDAVAKIIDAVHALAGERS